MQVISWNITLFKLKYLQVAKENEKKPLNKSSAKSEKSSADAERTRKKKKETSLVRKVRVRNMRTHRH